MQSKTTAQRTKINYTIGLPPSGATDDAIQGRTNTVMENSMPIAKIYPGTPSIVKGLTLFKRVPAFRCDSDSKDAISYLKLLNAHGFDLDQPNGGGSGNEGCLTVAYIADSFPTDSFTNEYGENFLQKFTNIASEGAGAIAQMRGATNVGQLFHQTTGSLKGMGGIPGAAGSLIEGVGDTAAALLRALLPKSLMGGVDIVSKLATDSRLDFPMLWKNSGFQPSYSMTIRLYNPAPKSLEATRKYIAGPIAALMLLAIPISTDGITYHWPFIHKIISPGIYNLDPAYISNITIIKGGDQQQIGYNQRLGVVDVRIDFGSLFSSMLASVNDLRTRPTLSTYLDAMVGDAEQSSKPGVMNFSTVPDIGISTTQRIGSVNQELLIQQTKNQASTKTELTNEEKDNPPNRVSASTSAIAAELQSRFPGGL